MHLKHIGILAGSILGAALVGCHSGSGSAAPSGTAGPTTMTVPQTNMQTAGPTTLPVPAANQTEVALPETKPPAAKDLTHVLTEDEPFYINEPETGSTAKPATTLKAGTKMLVVIPGATYSQVVTDHGLTGYTMTDGLKPLGK